MSEKVYEALGRVLENRKGAKQITIDGYSNFLTMTLNYYAHATFASARAEMERLIAA